MIIVKFFRDILDGIWYWLYLIACIISFFFVLGIVADNKREKINKKLKEKKSYDIESGREAAIAAMETKQVLSVNEEEKKEEPAIPQISPETSTNEVNSTEPVVMVINSNESIQSKEVVPATTESVVQQVVPPTVTPESPELVAVIEPAKTDEPLVINSN